MKSVLILLILSASFNSLKAVKVHPKSKKINTEPRQDDFLYDTFPENFLWGFSTSAYQTEGYREGRGENIWDVFSHSNNGSNIRDGSNGDIACDSYHKYMDDVAILKEVGASFYRISISWSRILPNGTEAGGINQDGIDFYNRFINALLDAKIIPFVTMYHWDLPQALQAIGGWPNEELAHHFEYFAKVLYTNFGDRVKFWMTFNEGLTHCLTGYAYGSHAPGFVEPEVLPYQCAHTIIKAHALAYRVYEKEFKNEQKGQVGITLDTSWTEPRNSSNPEDVAASERSMQFTIGWFANPLLRGEYPLVMREYVDRRSLEEGRETSRLPSFDSNWTKIINGTMDFMSLNTYTTSYVFNEKTSIPGYDGDSDLGYEVDPEWEEAAAPWLLVVPWGFRKVVTWITKEYNRIPIYVTENGFSDLRDDPLDDKRRVNYYNLYINELLKAIKLDGANVLSYTGWSLMDTFTMTTGYTLRWGAYYTNWTDPNLARVPKSSAKFLKIVFANNGFPASSNQTTTTQGTTQEKTTTQVTKTTEEITTNSPSATSSVKPQATFGVLFVLISFFQYI